MKAGLAGPTSIADTSLTASIVACTVIGMLRNVCVRPPIGSQGSTS